jgi:drug/metabolite transporter (DMT)-like permease
VLVSTFALTQPRDDVQTIFQSARTIPVMVAGVFFGKSYGALDYAVVLLMCIGLICFTLADAAAASAPFELFGVLMMAVSTSADAVRLNLSEKLMDVNGAARSVNELLFYSEAIGFAIVLPLTLLDGELWRALSYFPDNYDVLGELLLMGLMAFLGGLCQMQLVQRTSAFAVSLFGIGRRVLTIVASFVLFHKSVLRLHVLGASLFVLGLYLRSHASAVSMQKQIKKGRES